MKIKTLLVLLFLSVSLQAQVSPKPQNRLLGRLVKVMGNELSYLCVLDETEKMHYFLWMDHFEGADKILEPNGWQNANVVVYYNKIDLYSYKINAYTEKNKIVEVQFL